LFARLGGLTETWSKGGDMTDSPEAVFERHVAALMAGDLDSLAADYSEDALIITSDGEFRGQAGVREVFTPLMQALPEPTLEAKVAAFADDALFLRWSADSAANSVSDGVDTFVFADGKIRLQTISCTMTPKT
jgi:hypothetical protein